MKNSFNVALNNYFLLLNEVKFVKLTAETLFQYKMVTTHFLINALQPDQPPIHLCCHLSMLNEISMFSSVLQACNYKRGANLNVTFVPFLFQFSRFLYNIINNKRNFFSLFLFIIEISFYTLVDEQFVRTIFMFLTYDIHWICFENITTKLGH